MLAVQMKNEIYCYNHCFLKDRQSKITKIGMLTVLSLIDAALAMIAKSPYARFIWSYFDFVSFFPIPKNTKLNPWYIIGQS